MEEVLAYFQILGDEVERTWTAAGRRGPQLVDIAANALRDIPMPPNVTPDVILSLLATATQLPKQRKSTDPFGQPPAVMYRSPNFEIQALTWMEGTTSTHQHAFDGAFRVACGSSLQVRYSFEQSDVLADGHVVAGRLAMVEPEVLRTGDVRPIIAGPEFIHALFHLERPSMTIVVRNGSSELPFPQYDYRLPGLGFDVLDTDDKLRMRLRGLHSLYRLDQDRASAVARDVIATQDLWTAFRVCDDWALTYGETSRLAELIETLSKRASIFGEVMPPMYAEEVRRGRLLARRGMLHESRHRLFLALIVNLPDRASIHKVLDQLFPGEDPAILIVDIVEELASPQLRGISGLSLSKDDLSILRSQLTGGPSPDPLGLVSERWKPPSVIESLFS